VISAVKEKQVDKAIKRLNCDTFEEFSILMDWINKPRWIDNTQTKHNFTDEQMAELNKSEKVFDYFADFDAYFYDFFKLGIDLTDSDLDWFKFNWLLNGIIEDDKSMICKRMMARGYKSSKDETVEYRIHMNKKKSLYSLVEVSGIEKLGGKNG